MEEVSVGEVTKVDPKLVSMRELYCDDKLSQKELQELTKKILGRVEQLSDEDVEKFYEYPRFSTVSRIGFGSAFLFVLGSAVWVGFGGRTLPSMRSLKLMIGAGVLGWLGLTIGEESAHFSHRKLFEGCTKERSRPMCFVCELKSTHIESSDEQSEAQRRRKLLVRAILYQVILDRAKLSIWETLVPARQQDELIKQVSWTLERRLKSVRFQKPQSRARSHSWPGR